MRQLRSCVFEPIKKELLDTIELPEDIEFSKEQIRAIEIADKKWFKYL